MKNCLRAFSFFFFLLFTLSLSAQEFGIATYYSDDFHGRKTAYGDVYDKDELTAAHKKHPYGTILRITRLDNKKSVTVRVNDKGPYIKGRVVDVSKKAAERLGLTEDGVAEVKVEVVSRMAKETTKSKAEEAKKEIPKPKITRPEEYNSQSERRIATTTKAKATTRAEEPTKTSSTKTKEPAKTKAKKTTAKAKLVGKEYQKYGLYKIVLEKPSNSGWGVQVASLSNYENVLKQVADLQAKWFDNILISVERGNPTTIYKVILGPFDTEKAANNYQASLIKKHKIKGFSVNLSEISY